MINFYLYRLYTGPNYSYVSQILSSPAYKKVMEKNVHLELSFNDWSIGMEKTLKEPQKAYFGTFNKLAHDHTKYLVKSKS